MDSKIALLKSLESELKAVETFSMGKQSVAGADADQRVEEAIEKHHKNIAELKRRLENAA
jgi:TATA-box binding protein (TBP) (component of TFIID and TFIIIB)